MMKAPTQVFVKIDEFKDILDIVNVIKTKMNEANHTLQKIKDLKRKEDSELDMWQSHLDDVERKMANIDKTLFEQEM